MKIDHLLTEENISDFIETDERFTFCLDLLGLSLVDDGDDYCTAQVNRLENAFDRAFFRRFKVIGNVEELTQ